jgi:hypothetical protein
LIGRGKSVTGECGHSPPTLHSLTKRARLMQKTMQAAVARVFGANNQTEAHPRQLCAALSVRTRNRD